MDDAKLASAKKAVSLVKKGQTIGLGTGSTAEIFIDLLAERNEKEKLGIVCMATSLASEKQAKNLGLALVGFDKVSRIDAAFDGADQVDPSFCLIKGLGGALVREKIVDYRAEKFYVMVGENKMVEKLSGIVPVEVMRPAEEAVRRELLLLGARKADTRMAGAKKFISDNGNFILHAEFGKIEDPAALEEKINRIAGVVGNGIFTSKNVCVIVGRQDGTARILEADSGQALR